MGNHRIRTFTCLGCGKEFTGRYIKQRKYCSRKCVYSSRLSNKILKKCETCGKEYYQYPCLKDSRFCSWECRTYEGRPGYQNGETKKCVQCGKAYYVPKARVEKSKCCSIACFNKWQGRNKIEHTCEVCQKSFYMSPSYKKFRNTRFCSMECRDKSKKFKTELRERIAVQQFAAPNNLEILGYLILDDLGIKYQPQHLMANKFIVDAFAPDQNTIIQFDGDYWHGNPDRFKTLDNRQEKQVKKDQSQNAYFAKCGYTLLRFWESDIKKRPEWVKEHLKQLAPITPADN